ncbi:MAG: hypothetical protein PHH27_03110, partial [Candidatus Colwellbacteria bacterium]|nr:hypothetical protein [Candidatus Colwellbacteria bacterium]
AKTAKIAITIKSSTKVKEGVDLRHKGSPPPAGPPKAEMAIAMRSSTRVKEEILDFLLSSFPPSLLPLKLRMGEAPEASEGYSEGMIKM